MRINTFERLKEFENKLGEHITMRGLTYEQAEAIAALLPNLDLTLRLQWSTNEEGDWQAHYKGYYLTISESSPTIKVMIFRPMGGTIQWYNSSIDEAINDIEEHIEDNMHLNTCQA